MTPAEKKNGERETERKKERMDGKEEEKRDRIKWIKS